MAHIDEQDRLVAELNRQGSEPGVTDLVSAMMLEFLSHQIKDDVLLLDASGPSGVENIFSFGAVIYSKRRGILAKHYCGISVHGHSDWDLHGHPGEAMSLAITLGSIAARISAKGGRLEAIVMDSLNFAANLTTAEPLIR